MGNEGGKITSYDDLYIENSPGRASSLPEQQGASLDSRIRRLDARRSYSIVVGRKRSSAALHARLHHDDDSSDDSGGFRTDFSEPDFTSADEPKLKGILKTRRRRRGWGKNPDTKLTKFGSQLSINSSLLDNFLHTIVRSDSLESLDDKGAQEVPAAGGGVSPRDHATQVSPVTNHPSDGSLQPTSGTGKPSPTPTRKVNGIIAQPVPQQTTRVPPSPPPRSSSFRDTPRHHLLPQAPPPVPVRSASSSLVHSQIHLNLHQRLEKIKSVETADEKDKSSVEVSASRPTASIDRGRRRSLSVVELDDQLVVFDSPVSRGESSEESQTDNTLRGTPSATPRDTRSPGASYTSLTNIDTFVSPPWLSVCMLPTCGTFFSGLRHPHLVQRAHLLRHVRGGWQVFELDEGLHVFRGVMVATDTTHRSPSPASPSPPSVTRTSGTTSSVTIQLYPLGLPHGRHTTEGTY